jgi:hypothetical protein
MVVETSIFLFGFYLFYIYVRDVVGLDVTGNKCFDASEAEEEGINEYSNSFADAVFWSDLGNH